MAKVSFFVDTKKFESSPSSLTSLIFNYLELNTENLFEGLNVLCMKFENNSFFNSLNILSLFTNTSAEDQVSVLTYIYNVVYVLKDVTKYEFKTNREEEAVIYALALSSFSTCTIESLGLSKNDLQDYLMLDTSNIVNLWAMFVIADKYLSSEIADTDLGLFLAMLSFTVNCRNKRNMLYSKVCGVDYEHLIGGLKKYGAQEQTDKEN